MSKKLDRLYIRVDAMFTSDEKYLALPYAIRDRAYLYFLALNGWSRDKKTDGVLPEQVARTIGRAMEYHTSTVGSLLKHLARVGLVDLKQGQIIIPKYAKWQDTAEEIQVHRAVRQRAGKLGGEASGRSRREASASAHPKQNEAETETETETESLPSVETRGPSASPTTRAESESERADVVELCTAMADSVEERDEPRPRITAEWRKQARLLLDLDHRPLVEALELIRWLMKDPFWSANVLSVPTFRKQYPKLRLQRSRATSATNGADIDWKRYSDAYGGDLAPGGPA